MEAHDSILSSVLRATVGAHGNDYITKVVAVLGESVDADVVIASVFEAGNTARTKAVWTTGRLLPNLSYKIEGTPCEGVRANSSCLVPEGVQNAFPDDPILVELEAEAYVGRALVNHDNEAIGSLCILYRTPLAEHQQIARILEDVAIILGTELERGRVTTDLERASEHALANDRAKSRFLANIGHEVRAPLNGMLGCAARLKASTLDAPQERWVRSILQSGRGMAKLIDDLLDIGGLGQSKPALQQRSSVPALARAVEKDFSSRARSKGLRFTVEYSGADTEFLVTPHRVHSIVRNLADNAIRFTSHGFVRITLSLQQTTTGHPPASSSPAARTLCITVADSGPGIPATKQEAMERPLPAEEADDAPRHSGAGLGLTVARRTAETLGGSLRLDTAWEKGTSFVAEIPVQIQDDDCPGTPEALLQKLQPKVLLVEDNPMTLRMTRRMLEHLGCRVDTAENGLIALEIYREELFDVILMDCQMPEMDGFETVAALRRSGAKLPIVALTANALPGDRERCIEAGMDGYLAKPASLADLTRVLTQWVAAT